MSSRIPFLPYRLFFLYIEPISALAGAYYAAIEPTAYLHDLVAPTGGAVRSTPDTPARMALLQLANLYLLFALNERLVLSSTSSITTWKRMLFCLLVADFGHLLTMAPAGLEVFWKVWKWNAMMWGSIGFVYLGAAMRICFLVGLGITGGGSSRKQR